MIAPFPKPHPFGVPCPRPRPKLERRPKGKPMTLLAGFRCADGGILMCADREESGDGTKRSVSKLKEWKSEDAHFICGVSGTTVVVANLYERLGEEFQKHKGNLERSHKDIIGNVLRSIHKDFREFKEWEEVVIAAAFYRNVSIPVSSFLYGTIGSALEPVAEYACKGVGKDLARYFCHRLYEPWPGRRWAVLLAAFIFREVEDHVESVGRGTDMKYLATQQRKVWTVPHGYIRQLEATIPTLQDAIVGAWAKGIQIPEWLAADLYSGEQST